MGQKVNPISFRIPQSRDWKSLWFSANKREYQKNLLEDVRIRKFLLDKLKLAGISRVQIERSINKMKIFLHVSRPGVVIGRGGSGLEMLKKEICQMVSISQPEKNLEIEAVEIRNPDLNAYLVAQKIAQQLERRMPYRRVVNRTIENVMAVGAKGVKVVLAGRIAGAEISRNEKFGDKGKTGNIPAQTLRADIDFASVPSLTRSGFIGVKVWIYKGEIQKNKK
jgi:small subunit ribosomal protein S3